MGFVKAIFDSASDTIKDNIFKEFITVPDGVGQDVLAIKGSISTRNPDGQIKQNNKNTGLITDGSVIVVPFGYVALMINNGAFISDVAEPGEYLWDSNSNPHIMQNGGFKGLWDNFKNRLAFGGQVAISQEVIFIRTQPIVGNKFGTTNPIEYFSERYQNILNIRFYGIYDFKISDPVVFYINNVSRQITSSSPFLISELGKDSIKKSITNKVGLSIAKYTNINKTDISSINANQEEFNIMATNESNSSLEELFGINLIRIYLEDISYDSESLAIIRTLDSQLFAMKTNTIEIEERRARNEALIAAAKNEGNGNGMNLIMGMNIGQTLSNQMTQQELKNTFYIEVDSKYILVTKDENGNIIPVK